MITFTIRENKIRFLVLFRYYLFFKNKTIPCK